MKYKLINPELNNQLNSLPLSHIVLKNRQIHNPSDYLSLDDGAIVNYRHIANIELARDCLLKHIEQGDKIGVLVDCDPDGQASAAILYKHLAENYDASKLEYYIHSGKQHGLSDDIAIPNTIQLLIIPDAGSNDVEQCKELQDRGIDVIILDHHLIERENPYAIILNNQIGSYPNRSLSGCGVTKKFLEILDNEWWSDSNKYYDLVALSIISDSMSLKERENKRIVDKGLSQIKNKLFLALLEKQSYSTKNIININTISFYITPLLNALIRMGTFEEKDLLFRAFLETDEIFPYKKPGKDSVETQENIYEKVARISTNLKAKQAREVEKSLVDLHAKIDKYHWAENNKIMFCNADGIDWSLTGLVAIKVANEYNRPCLLLRENKDGVLSGSARNFSSAIPDLKGYLENTQLFESLQGHSAAFGASIKKENLKPAIAKINEDLKDVDISLVYDVDFVFAPDEVTYQFICEMDKLKSLYATDIPESLSVIKGLKINTNDIELIGKEKDTWKFNMNDGEYSVIKFKCNEDDAVLMAKDDDWSGVDLELNLVVKFGLNDFNGITTGQAIVVDYEVVK